MISRPAPALEALESRRLFAWSAAAQLVDQDAAALSLPSLTGTGVTVAVIDTGINYNLAPLGGGLGSGKKVVDGYDFVDNDTDPMDIDGHGTAVAAAIAARPYTTGGVTYQGVAPGARLVGLRVGSSDSIPTANIERALQWVVTNYTTHGISIVNLSLGSGNYPDSSSGSILADEFATLRELGIFVVAASGNSNDEQSGPISEDGVSYPAADPNVFAVGAVDSNDAVSTWTQRGDELDLLAAGVDIVLPALDGTYDAMSGTSFAAPQVAGAAALIKQLDRTTLPGDIGSILMSSGTTNRDGDNEFGDTTGLLFSRLDIDAALALTKARIGRGAAINFGTRFDTALDSQGVLHAAWYDTSVGRVLYATRNVRGLWSYAYVVDQSADVGANLSIAVDAGGHVGVGYFDVTNTAMKYASYDVNGGWSTVTVESDKHVGLSPSLAYDINGNAYLAYYRRSGGNLKLAILDRDAGTWTRDFIDGLDGADVGAVASLDVGEAAVRTNGGFTIYDTTVAIGYADSTNGDLKYARLDLDDPAATWFLAVADDRQGVSSITLNLHASTTVSGVQAQIAYQDAITADVRFAYRNIDWFVETVAGPGRLGDTVQLYFDPNDRPLVAYSNEGAKTIYTALRTGSNAWSSWKTGQAWGPMSAALNERSGEAIFSFLSRSRDNVFSVVAI
ncbi:MAG: S8 family serine peptidase [Planctomycetota bacterium]|nr:S8 family serine peptidase [Planctomycetota bacterium]